MPRNKRGYHGLSEPRIVGVDYQITQNGTTRIRLESREVNCNCTGVFNRFGQLQVAGM